jgi:hypothetical protein
MQKLITFLILKKLGHQSTLISSNKRGDGSVAYMEA